MAATVYHENEAEALEGQILIWNMMLSYSQSIAMKAAISLEIPDIIAESEKDALSVEEIASKLEQGKHSSSVQLDYLSRIMRFLSFRGTFKSTTTAASTEILYSNNAVSKCVIAKKNPYTLVPMVRLHLDTDWNRSWHHLESVILEGANGMVKGLGEPVYVYTQTHPQFSDMFSAAMASLTKPAVTDILAFYDGFDHIHTLVDVGGGIGMGLSQIISTYPHIHGINLDLPHVAATAPKLPGIEHVGGNMFESIPSADAIFMKNVLHGWSDEHSLSILKNCCKALGEEGKVVMIEAVMNPKKYSSSNKTEHMKLSLDLVMLAHGTGRERSENDWRKLLSDAGFDRVNFYRKEHCTRSIIEAFKC